MKLEEKIRQHLHENGQLQVWLSYVTGISESKLSKALCGHRRLNIDEYELICSALGVPPGTFLEERPVKGNRHEPT